MPALSFPQISYHSLLLAAPSAIHPALRFLNLPCWPIDSARQRRALAEYLRSRLAENVSCAVIFPNADDPLLTDQEALDRQIRRHVRTVRLPRDWQERIRDRADLLGFAVRRRPRKPPPKRAAMPRGKRRSPVPASVAPSPWGALARAAFVANKGSK